MLPAVDLRALPHFLACVRHGSLTDAAEALGISQPALSKAIQRLEASVGAPLLERGRFGVSPTPFGEALAARAEAIQAEIGRARDDIHALQGRGGAELVMGCGPSEANRLLPRALALLAKRHPGLRVTVLYGLNEALMPWVRQGEIELALSSVPGTATDPLLEHEHLFTDSAAVFARADHPLAGRRSVSVRDLASYPFCLARRRELERRALDELFLAAGLRAPEAAIETTSAVLMKSAVLESNYLTFLPRELAHPEERDGRLVALPVAGGPSWSRIVGITRRRGQAPGIAATRLVDALRELARASASAAGTRPRRR